jgi:hypothetical protein
MAEIAVATPTNGVPGVMETPPSQIRGAIRAAVAEALANVPPGRQMVKVAVSLETGVNLVYAFKSRDGGHEHWEIVSWLGKDWSGDLTAGGTATFSWGGP